MPAVAGIHHLMLHTHPIRRQVTVQIIQFMVTRVAMGRRLIRTMLPTVIPPETITTIQRATSIHTPAKPVLNRTMANNHLRLIADQP